MSTTKLFASLLTLWLATFVHLQVSEAEDGFLHLLDAASSNRRLHISAEIVQEGQVAVYTEEFLDLDTFNQLIQIKWSAGEDDADDDGGSSKGNKDGPAQAGRMRKVNVVILNSEQKSFIYRYEPFECTLNELRPANSSRAPDDGWQGFRKPSESAPGDPKQLHKSLVESIVSTAPNSPYLTRVEASNANGSRAKHDSWILGLSGLWAKAQFGGSPPARVYSGSAWRTETAGLMIDFYMNSFMLAGDDGRASKREPGDEVRTSQSYDAPSLISIKEAKDGSPVQLINVFQVEYNFADRLAQNLFKLPIGFDCPANPFLDKSRVYMRDQASQLVQLEIVANKYVWLASKSLYSQTAIKSVQVSRVKHPVDLNSSLVMFHAREDRFKLIYDYYYQLEYRLQFNGTAHRCATRPLSFAQDPRTQHQRLTTPNLLQFDNDIVLDLNLFHLDYLLNLADQDKSMAEMRLLNVFEVKGGDKNELIFESEVPEVHKEMLLIRDSTGRYVDRQLTLVRVYEQQMTRARGAAGRRAARGFVDLKRALILVFDVGRKRKLAEVRLNLADELVQTISHSRRAKLFDLSACFERRQQTMELVVSYAAEPKLLEFAQEHGQTLIERFYQSAIDWHLAGNVSNLDSRLLEKERLGLSLNFLRMPRVELSGSPGGDLELRVTLLDKLTPLQLFERVGNSNFVSAQNGPEEGADSSTMLLESVEECARFCQLYHCKVFAYNSRNQCRLTQLPLLAASTSREVATANRRAVKLTLDSFNEVYFEPEWLRDKRYKEATLAELNAYLEHFSAELANYFGSQSSEGQLDDQEDESRDRRKRAASVKGATQPLFSFDFVDKSDLQDEFSPPGIRMLVPNELSITHLPLVLDVSESAESVRVSRSFQVTAKGSMYYVAALNTSKHNDNEASFIDERKRCYYTLKKVHSIGQHNCAYLCFNIDEWSGRTRSLQQCVSFSYSHQAELCVLAIQTDFGFVSSGAELAEAGEQLAKVGSLSKLLVTIGEYDGLVATRNHLPQFEGPVRMAAGAHGYATTDGFQFDLQFEWLQALVVESSQPDGQELEACAAKCVERNNMQAGVKTCLAFDFCTTKFKDSQDAERRYRVLCDLLLVREEESGPNWSELSNLRDHLSQKTELPSSGLEQATKPTGANNRTILADSCNRYLLSHLREFTHLSQRQLLAGGAAKRLEIIDETSADLSLHDCALECSIRGQRCLMFEFCLAPNSPAEQTKLTQNCTLFTSAHSSASLAKQPEDILEPEVASSDSAQLTSYNRNCHVYLRRQFGSIEEAIAYREGAAPASSGCTEFEHTRLAVWFSVVYFSIALAGVVYAVRKHKMALRARLTELLHELNERYLARR